MGILNPKILDEYDAKKLNLDQSPWQEFSINQAHLLRGAIIGAWASVETNLIELAIRSSYHEAYEGVRDTYPSRIEGRVKYLRKIISMDGPLKPFQRIGSAVMDRYENGAEIRNIMAHANMTTLGWVEFKGFKAKGESIELYRENISYKKLERIAYTATKFSRHVFHIVWLINNQKLIPALEPMQIT